MLGVGSLGPWPLAQGGQGQANDVIAFTDSASGLVGRFLSDIVNFNQALKLARPEFPSDTIPFVQVAVGINTTAQPNSFGATLHTCAESSNKSSFSAPVSVFAEEQVTENLSSTLSTLAEVNSPCFGSTLYHNVSQYPFTDKIIFSDVIGLVAKGIQVVGSVASFSDTATAVVFPGLKQTITHIQHVRVYLSHTQVWLRSASDTVSFTQVSSAVKTGRPVNSTISFSDTVSLHIVKKESIIDPIWFGHGLKDVSNFGPMFIRAAGPQTSNIQGDTLTPPGPEELPLYDISVSDLSPDPTDVIAFTDVASNTAVRNASRIQTIYFADRIPPVFNAIASDTINFLQFTFDFDTHHLSDTITFSDSASDNQVFGVHQVISFNDSVSVTRGLTQSIVFQQALALQQTLHLSLTDTITFTDKATRIFPETVSNTITFIDLTTAVASHFIHDTISFTQTLSENVVLKVSVTDPILFTQAVSAYDTSLRDSIVFNDTVKIAFLRSASNTVVFTDRVDIVHNGNVTDIINFLSLASASASSQASDTILYAQTALINGTFHLSVFDTALFTDGTFGVTPREDPCAESYAISLGARNNIVLTYPYVGPALTLILRNPRFGNIDSVDTSTVFRRTNLANLSVVRNSNWPTIEMLKVSFEALSQAQRDAIINFMQQSAASEVGYLDQENRQWRGVITTAEIETVQTGIGCQFETSFEFRGRLA